MTEKQKQIIQEEIMHIMNSLNAIIDVTECFPENIQFGNPQDYLDIMNALFIKEGKEPIILPLPNKNSQ